MRRNQATIRPVEPDPVHRSRLVQQVINKVMVDGKKSTAESIVYEALEILSRRTNNEAVPSKASNHASRRTPSRSSTMRSTM